MSREEAGVCTLSGPHRTPLPPATQLLLGGKTGFGVPAAWRPCLGRGVDQAALCFCSWKRSPDTDAQKPPNLSEASGPGQGPDDDGLLVTHVNQTRDLLVETAAPA